jgi:pimeloyl-ACP methyl ester carboxylesterase
VEEEVLRPPPDAVHTAGRGADVVFIHGAAGDKSSWRQLVALLRARVRATVYDRRGAGSWPMPEDEPPPLVGDHAEDAADLIRSLGTHPVHVCAVSFGAVVALELLKRRPELVRSAVLFEPALSGDDGIPSVPPDLAREVERLSGSGETERAAEYFHRRALGDAAWQRLPPAARKELTSRGEQIRRDLLANAAHRVGYDELRDVLTPVLLLQGGRSREVFERPLRTLHEALPRASRQRIERAAHVPFGDAWPEFAAALTAFIGV